MVKNIGKINGKNNKYSIICHAFEQFYCTAYPKSSAEAFGSGLG
jgi:hypothetical protein